jgi:hypothetical protein
MNTFIMWISIGCIATMFLYNHKDYKQFIEYCVDFMSRTMGEDTAKLKFIFVITHILLWPLYYASAKQNGFL